MYELTGNPITTAQQVAEVILRDTSLSARILSLVNSSFYRRAKPIMTITQAVVAVGMKGIAELCTGLVLIQRFIPLAGRGGPYATCLQKALVTSLLSSNFSSLIGGQSLENEIHEITPRKGNELGFIAGFFSEIGTLLLAYYFPKLYEAGINRAVHKNISVEKSLWQLTGKTAFELNIEVVTSLNLPEFFLEVLRSSKNSTQFVLDKHKGLDKLKVEVAAASIKSGNTVSEAIQKGTKEAIDSALLEVSKFTGISIDEVVNVTAQLPGMYSEHCALTQLPLPALPPYISHCAQSTTETKIISEVDSRDAVTKYIAELQSAVNQNEPMASVITTAVEALSLAMHFPRTLLLLLNERKRKFEGRMIIDGTNSVDPKTITLSFDEDCSKNYMEALKTSCPIYTGDPLLPYGWPFVIIPVGTVKKGVGLIYADHINENFELTDQTKAVAQIISDLLHKAMVYTR